MHIDLTDQYRHRPSPLHRVDPRVKIVAVLLYILVLGLTPSGAWLAFAGALALILGASAASRLGFLYAARRAFVALPFVLAALAVPFVTPGATLFSLPWVGWSVTTPGLIRFASILLRTWLAVQGAILLSATTRFHDLLWALGALRVPQPLVSTIGFMYRYLFVLADEALRMMRARSSRSARPEGSSRPPLLWAGRVTGSMVGSLLLRSLERSERVYAAMASRGYGGQIRPLARFRMQPADWAGLALALTALAVLLSVALMG